MFTSGARNFLRNDNQLLILELASLLAESMPRENPKHESLAMNDIDFVTMEKLAATANNVTRQKMTNEILEAKCSASDLFVKLQLTIN